MKKFIWTFGFVLIVSIAFLIYINLYETTPVMKNVTNVYLEFVDANRLYNSYGAGYTKKEITEPVDKDYLINFFNNKYELDTVGCGCPYNNIKIVFEKNNATYTFGIGIVGDGNIFYYNSDKYVLIPYEKYNELLTFFSKFDETVDYEQSNLNLMRD